MRALHSLLTCRILLNIRRVAASRSNTIDLSYDEIELNLQTIVSLSDSDCGLTSWDDGSHRHSVKFGVDENGTDAESGAWVPFGHLETCR